MTRYRPLSAEEIQLLALEQRNYDTWASVRSWAVGWYGPDAASVEVEWDFEGEGEEGARFQILGVSVLDGSGEFLSLDPDAPKTRAVIEQYRRSDASDEDEDEDEDEESLEELLALIEEEDDTYLDERNALPFVSQNPWELRPSFDLSEEPERRWKLAYVRDDDDTPDQNPKG